MKEHKYSAYMCFSKEAGERQDEQQNQKEDPQTWDIVNQSESVKPSNAFDLNDFNSVETILYNLRTRHALTCDL